MDHRDLGFVRPVYSHLRRHAMGPYAVDHRVEMENAWRFTTVDAVR